MLDRVQTPEPARTCDTAPLDRLRVRGGVALRFENGSHGTSCADLSEADGYRARLPALGHCEAVLLNTGGGVAGGDVVAFAVTAGAGAQAVVTSVAAERIYRSNGPEAAIGIDLTLEPDACLAYLPQETILYDGARLARQITVDMAASARLTLLDMLVLGRRGSGERMRSGGLRDSWHVRRDGRLVHREALRLDGDPDAGMAGAATGGGAHCIATLLHLAPDAADRLDAVRAALGSADDIELAASAWNGKLVVRALARDGADMIDAMARLIPVLTGRPAPRNWNA